MDAGHSTFLLSVETMAVSQDENEQGRVNMDNRKSNQSNKQGNSQQGSSQKSGSQPGGGKQAGSKKSEKTEKQGGGRQGQR
jgi:hypothetical protein